MTLSYRSALALTALAALGLTATAHAQTTQFSTRASFTAATTGLTTFTFDGDAPNNNATFYFSGLTVQGVGFAASNQQLYVDDPSDNNGDPFGGHQYLDTDAKGTLTVSLPAGTTAFGADFSNYGFNSSGGSTITALVNGVAFTFAEPDKTSAAFAGFTSSVPITSLSFSGGSKGVALDNVSFGPTPATRRARAVRPGHAGGRRPGPRRAGHCGKEEENNGEVSRLGVTAVHA